MVSNRFQYPTYMLRRKVFKLFGGAFHIFNPQGEVVFFANMKAFKLREDIRLYTGEDMQQEILTINARQILDISAVYDVVDPTTRQKVGALKRKGLKSVIRDEWLVMDANDREIGLIQEDSTAMALLRRFLTNLIPQSFNTTINGAPVATMKQNFNPFVLKITLDFSRDFNRSLDRRLGIAAAILLCAIEGRQN
jgi:uncharacterized protein YxjI